MNNISARSGFPLDRRGKALLGLWSLFLLAGFSVAIGLEPDPRGFGTHQQLGLPPCTFQVLFKIPCPSCGMTTSFSNFVRGRFVAAAEANTAGLLLAGLCALQIPWCWWSLYHGRMFWVERPAQAVVLLLILICGVTIVHWFLRMMLI